MAVKETAWQKKIIDSAKALQGYGKKWATQYSVGVPDLILSLPSYGLFLMEVKLIKDIPASGKFSRKVNTTDKQKLELRKFSKAGALSCVGMITYCGPREVYLTVLPYDTEQFTSDDLQEGVTVRWNDPKENIGSVRNMFDLHKAMHNFRYGGRPI